jgi:hypothetical protein
MHVGRRDMMAALRLILWGWCRSCEPEASVGIMTVGQNLAIIASRPLHQYKLQQFMMGVSPAGSAWPVAPSGQRPVTRPRSGSRPPSSAGLLGPSAAGGSPAA